MIRYTSHSGLIVSQRSDGTLVKSNPRKKPKFRTKHYGMKCERFDVKQVIRLRKQKLSLRLIAHRLGRTNRVGIWKVLKRYAPELINIKPDYTIRDLQLTGADRPY